MKKLNIILFFLVSFYGLAQNINELKKSDTIYFYFSENQSQKKDIIITKPISKDTMLSYSYYLNDSLYLKLSYKTYKNFDDYFNNIQTTKEYLKKKFLKKNKSIIINVDILNNIGLNSSEFLELLKNKKLFIIDKQEFTRRKILIREVFINMLDAVSDDTQPSLIKTRNIIPFYLEMQMDNDFYTFLNPKVKVEGGKDIYILFEHSFNTHKYVYKYVTQLGEKKYSEPKIQEQYTFKLKIKNQNVFFQLTNKRNQETELPKKYDLFSKKHTTISIEELDDLSEKQLDDLFSEIGKIYIVENFRNTISVKPKLVFITAEINDFVIKNR